MGPLLRFACRFSPVVVASLALSLAAACNAQVATVLASDTDAATVPATGTDASPTGTTGPSPTTDAGPAPIDPAFCTGSSARMSINGEDVPIFDVRGHGIAMNCCDSGEVAIATGRFQAIFYLLWRVSAGKPSGPIDVAALPQGSSLELDLGCDPATTSCATASAEDRFDGGFEGTIDYAPTSTGMSASYCISVAEPSGSPHAVLHTVQIYIPNLASPY